MDIFMDTSMTTSSSTNTFTTTTTTSTTPSTPLPIHALSRPRDWFHLLHYILISHGLSQRTLLAWLSLIYIVGRLPLALWTCYQIYRYAVYSNAVAICISIVVFLMWILEKEINLVGKCYGLLENMGKEWVERERGRRIREVWRLSRRNGESASSLALDSNSSFQDSFEMQDVSL